MGLLETWVTMIYQAFSMNFVNKAVDQFSRIVYICIAGGAILGALIITRR